MVYTKFISKTNNPHIKMISKNKYPQFITAIINEYKNKSGKKKIKLLDIGGGKGWGSHLYNNKSIEYYALDLKTSRKEDKITFIQGDITDKTLQLDNTYDIIFTKDTFEHILNPWDATQNILTNLVDGGYFIFLAPFSWRYHASPYDTFRYTHTGAQYMFERLGQMKKKIAGYINFGNINGFWKNRKDHTIDNKPFPKCLEVMYVGEKDIHYDFNKNDLDIDASWNHST